MKITPKMNISRLIKRLIRESCSAHSNCPIKIIDGNSRPRIEGQTFHYENKSGDLIRHPNAYKAAWGKPIYIHSTLRVEVGSDWILNNLSLFEIRMLKLKAFA